MYIHTGGEKGAVNLTFLYYVCVYIYYVCVHIYSLFQLCFWCSGYTQHVCTRTAYTHTHIPYTYTHTGGGRSAVNLTLLGMLLALGLHIM